MWPIRWPFLESHSLRLSACQHKKPEASRCAGDAVLPAAGGVTGEGFPGVVSCGAAIPAVLVWRSLVFPALLGLV